MNDLGFSSDVDYDGMIVQRPDAITCESMHRAKSLSNDQCRKQRIAIITAMEDNERAKLQKQKDDMNTCLSHNEECQRVLHDILTKSGRQTNFDELTLSDFGQKGVKLMLLKPFYMVRVSKSIISLGNIKKGTVSQANAVEDCMILRAYRCRNEPILMQHDNDNAAALSTQENITQSQVTVIPSSYAMNTMQKASSFLNNNEWMTHANSVVHGDIDCNVALVNNQVDVTDAISTIVMHRLNEYVNIKWANTEK